MTSTTCKRKATDSSRDDRNTKRQQTRKINAIVDAMSEEEKQRFLDSHRNAGAATAEDARLVQCELPGGEVYGGQTSAGPRADLSRSQSACGARPRRESQGCLRRTSGGGRGGGARSKWRRACRTTTVQKKTRGVNVNTRRRA